MRVTVSHTFYRDPDDREEVYNVTCSLSGGYSPATYENPAEYPESEVEDIHGPDGKPIPPVEWEVHGFTKDVLKGCEEKALEEAPSEEYDGPDRREDD